MSVLIKDNVFNLSTYLITPFNYLSLTLSELANSLLTNLLLDAKVLFATTSDLNNYKIYL
nr:MAG TPA: hypothetical protein [Caudoviricetes sp.]